MDASDFDCHALAEDIYLLTYTLLQNKTRLTRRSTLWHKTPDGWKALHRQGTMLAST